MGTAPSAGTFAAPVSARPETRAPRGRGVGSDKGRPLPRFIPFRKDLAIRTLAPTPERSAWLPVAAHYGRPDRELAVRQLVTSFLPYVALWSAMALSLHVGYWLTLLLALPTAGFLVRIFIVQHDCGHGSFLRSRKMMDLVGSLAAIITLVPYDDWRRSHAIHHANAGRLSERGIGDVSTLTIDEYRSRGRMARLRYRVYRNPLMLFVISPLVLFLILYRFPSRASRLRLKDHVGLLATNLAIGGAWATLAFLVGFRHFLMVQAPITVIASSLGMWLFYVQHQFEGTYWSDGEEWDYTAAALHGSSYYRLPRLLQWFVGNIGFHHIHHLSPRIPNYHLERCHVENPMLQDVPTLTLRSSLRTVRLALWDEEAKQAGELRRPAAPARRAGSARPRPPAGGGHDESPSRLSRVPRHLLELQARPEVRPSQARSFAAARAPHRRGHAAPRLGEAPGGHERRAR